MAAERMGFHWAIVCLGALLILSAIVIAIGGFTLWSLWFAVSPIVAYLEDKPAEVYAYIACATMGALLAAFTIALWEEITGSPPGPVMRQAIIALWVCIAATWIIVAKPGAAFAHSFYDANCCSDRDCRPLEWEWVKTTPEGYWISEPGALAPAFVPFGDKRIRPSPAEDLEQRFHICTQGGLPNGRVLCLYVPTGGA